MATTLSETQIHNIGVCMNNAANLIMTLFERIPTNETKAAQLISYEGLIDTRLLLDQVDAMQKSLKLNHDTLYDQETPEGFHDNFANAGEKTTVEDMRPVHDFEDLDGDVHQTREFITN